MNFGFSVLNPLPKGIWGSIFVISIGLNCVHPQVRARQEPVIKVFLKESTQLNFRADRKIPFLIKGLENKEKKLTSLKLEKINGRFAWKTRQKVGGWKYLPPNAQLIIRSFDKRGVWLGNRRYAGELRVKLQGDTFAITNHLRIEKYLKSVVGSEMPKSWPMAALKAQAVAARTYALKQRGKQNIYDVKSTEVSQVYIGLEAETPRTRRAVNNTRSLVMFYKGKLISAVFHSSSGGQTEDSGMVWKYQLPYLISVPDFDHHSPKYQWKKSYKTSQLKEIFYEIEGVNSIQVLKTSNTGRVLKARVYGPKGDLVLTGKELRTRLDAQSTLMKFRMLPNPLKNNSLEREYLYLKDQKLSPGPLPAIPEEYYLLVKGFGSGHGVGMSQWGAHGLAKKGANFRQILKHYYQNIDILPY